jgi:hypothetical protein
MLALARRILEGDQSPGPDPRGDAVQNMTTIERGDRAEYLRLAGQNPLSILLTVCLYSLAVWLIMLVIKVQAGAVVRAAGWHSLGDLLFH